MTLKENAKKAIPNLMLVLKTLTENNFSLALSGDVLLALLLKRKAIGKVKYTSQLEFVTMESSGKFEREVSLIKSILTTKNIEFKYDEDTMCFNVKRIEENIDFTIKLSDSIKYKNEGTDKLLSYPFRYLCVEEYMVTLIYKMATCDKSENVIDYYLLLEMGYSLTSLKIKMFLDKHKLELNNLCILDEPLDIDEVYEGLESEDVIRSKVKESLIKFINILNLPGKLAPVPVKTEPIEEIVKRASERVITEEGVFQLNHSGINEEGKPIPTHIREKLLELADVVQPWLYHGVLCMRYISDLKNRSDLQNIVYFRFWEEVSSKFLKKTVYKEFEVYRLHEQKYRKSTEPFFNIFKASRSDNGYYVWMRLNRRYFDYIQPTLDAVYDIKESIGRDVSTEKTVFTDESLRFIYKKASEITTEKEFFDLLPQIQWAIENLLLSKKDHLYRHRDALNKVFIHGMLKHTNAANQFLNTLKKLDAYFLSGENIDEIHVFTPDGDLSNETEEKYPPVPLAEACHFVQTLSRVLEGEDSHVISIDTYKIAFRETPYAFVFRYLANAHRLNILDQTFFPISKEQIDKLYLELENRQILYSEENIATQILRILLLLEEEESNLEFWSISQLLDIKRQAIRAAEVMSITKLISGSTYSELLTKIDRLATQIRLRIEGTSDEMVQESV